MSGASSSRRSRASGSTATSSHLVIDGRLRKGSGLMTMVATVFAVSVLQRALTRPSNRSIRYSSRKVCISGRREFKATPSPIRPGRALASRTTAGPYPADIAASVGRSRVHPTPHRASVARRPGPGQSRDLTRRTVDPIVASRSTSRVRHRAGWASARAWWVLRERDPGVEADTTRDEDVSGPR